MKLIFFLFCLSSTAFGSTFNCAVKWKTLSEDLPTQEVSLKKQETLKVTDNFSVILTPRKNGVQLEVSEVFKSNKDSSLIYRFFCDRNFNCEGEQRKKIEGKTTKADLKISPSGYIVRGSIDGRDFFTYQNLRNKSFEYNFIAYYSDNREPLGLKMVCHE